MDDGGGADMDTDVNHQYHLHCVASVIIRHLDRQRRVSATTENMPTNITFHLILSRWLIAIVLPKSMK